ncbi:hypothetical protein BUALT_Bualt05G0130000 [Buddleja alternifolia]|uniref:Ubiquitin receptor RAD23 n=1 Tax=Buddleja alternifolia TaxID=168488 RepID=A0AAV6XV83_9LAMI|nr:hypothetical protein BUALT_Bualt05G0130000 [Buddleja alternifolia]
MKIFVKTLKGTHFEIEVKSEDTVEDVKKTIESTQGADVYPAAQLMLIHQGKVLKDGTTLEENKVAESSFVVVMLSKSKGSSGEGSTTSSVPTKAPHTSTPPPTSTPASTTPQPPAPVAAPAPLPTPASVPAASDVSDVYGQAASNLVAGTNLEGSIQQILDMGGGTWDRDTVIRALRAAYNNPERAVEYLYSGIPESAEAPPTSGSVPSMQAANVPAQPQQAAQPAAVPSTGPNANPLNLFPQGFPSVGSNAGGANNLEFLRNSPQVELFPSLESNGAGQPADLTANASGARKAKSSTSEPNTNHQADFLRLINEPIEGGEGDLMGQLAGALPQTITVTPEESEAIERLEAMGFNRELVVEVFFACNKNEELAANYLLDHVNDFEE